MKPTGQSLFTKGIQALEKGISLATKGILDRIGIKKGGESEPRHSKFFEIFFLVHGIKQFNIKLTYKVVGQKTKELAYVNNLIGKKSINCNKQLMIDGILSSILNSNYIINAKKSNKISKDIFLKAIKQISLSDNKLINGSKQIKLGTEQIISGRKQFEMSTTNRICGKKEIKLNQEEIIKGKRNITNILLALDLFEETK